MNKKARILLVIVGLLLVSCFPEYYPDAPSEMTQGAIDSQRYDEWKQSQYDKYADQAEQEMQDFERENQTNSILELPDPSEIGKGSSSKSSPDEGCPDGCASHKSGCDIKGNISINTGEKIYHLPGQEYYEETRISPEYGERWFCTEAEARANGWRKSRR